MVKALLVRLMPSFRSAVRHGENPLGAVVEHSAMVEALLRTACRGKRHVPHLIEASC